MDGISDEKRELTPEALHGKRVAICEDEGVTVFHLGMILKRAGLHLVGAVDNGEAGVELVLREKPDIVLMDITMPRMNGLEATRQIRQRLSTCIVMLTAYSDQGHIEKAREYGAAGYLVKPVDSKTLIPGLCKALNQFYNCMP